MAENVYKSLKGRRYLIVLDDVWSTKAWDDVRRIFPDDHKGSRIVLTTRLWDVAAYPDSSSPLHKMRFMDLDQSWNLLQKKVFPRGNCPPELEDIGKTIARSYRGLPLAIVVIAGLLSTVSQILASWENIARNVNEAVTANHEQFAEIVLSLSYNHLPHHLRPCFLYMRVFPEDYVIRASKLIKLWVAEGFLEVTNGSKSSEEVAEEYLEDLVNRSLILVTSRKPSGKIKSCSIHDLVADLCISKAQQEKFLVRIRNSRFLEESIKNQQRVSVTRSADLDCLKDIYDLHIHTIICTNRWSGRDSGWDCLRNIRLLRVLHVEEYFGFLSPFWLQVIIRLFHLRYLALSYPVKIPAATSYLQNLQTLIIYPEKESRSAKISAIARSMFGVILPCQVWKLLQLRHLVSFYFNGLPNSEAAHDPLENLQTLSEVKNFKCTERILQMIPNLKKLGISYSEDEYVGDYQLQNLQHLHQLEKLRLKIKGDLPSFAQMVRPPLFPTTLKRLTLSGKQRSWEDMGIIGSLPNLEELKLKDVACFGDTWETSEGEFCQLKYLLISQSDLQDWITESSHFPRLRCLVLNRCLCLSEIPDGIGEILTLELIKVDDWNKSLLDSARRIQEGQREYYGNDTLEVRLMT